MNNSDIIRAWKDPGYRHNLSGEELARMPANPAGTIELTDDLLDQVAAGQEEEASTNGNFTSGCCQSIYNSCYTTCSTPGTCVSWCIACSY